MDQHLTNLDSKLCRQPCCYSDVYDDIKLSILLNTVKVPFDLYNRICNHPDVTPEIIISLLKQISVDKYMRLSKCRLITPEFCDKFKDTFLLHPAIMIINCFPVDYIVSISNGYVFADYEIHGIAIYCTYEEYIKYCKPVNIPPCLENMNLTVEWYIDNTPNDDSLWDTCMHVRPDLFTIDVIIKYKDRITKKNKIWYIYFNQLPGSFIKNNIGYNYGDVYECIDIFKKHPDNISWYTIDKYISINTSHGKPYMLDVPFTVTDLPRWFLIKYKSHISYIHIKNINMHVHYKFIVNNTYWLCNQFIDITKCRKKYVELLKDITMFCNQNYIIPDLDDYILHYV